MFVVYHIDSLRIVTRCETLPAAKRSCTAQNKKVNRQNGKRLARYNEMHKFEEVTPYAVTTQEDYDTNLNTWTETYNMLDPLRRPIKIRKADKGGCCDPATETYHSS